VPISPHYIEETKSADLALLFTLVRADVKRTEADDKLAAGNINWPYITHMARRHGMTSILYANLKKLGLVDQLPDAPFRFLKSQYLQVTGGNMRLGKRLAEIIGILAAQGVPVVPFKGPVLTQMLYNDAALRYCQDLDVLVPRDQAAAARDALRDAGYFHRDPPLEALDAAQFEKFAASEKEFELIDPAGTTMIDLHWRLVVGGRPCFDYTFCRDRLGSVDFGGREVACLSDEDMVVYLCVHGSSEGWINLGAVLCLAEYIKQHPDLDWDQVLALAGILRSNRMLFLGLFLARDLFGAALPEIVAMRMKNDRQVPGLVARIYRHLFQTTPAKPPKKHIERRFSDIPYQIAVREHVLDKLKYLLRMLFAPTQKDWRDLPVRARFSFLLFLRRPVVMGVELVKSVVGGR